MSVPVSVIVPTYNRASLIGETLESILKQSCAPAEVIVVDDGSTDETESVVRQFPTTVKYFRIQNSGAAIARNVGASKSNSPWLAFCDSDDLWTEDKLKKQLNLHRESGVDYSFTNFRIITGGQWKPKTKFDKAPPGFFDDFEARPHGLILQRSFYDEFVGYHRILPSTIMISSQLFNQLGGFAAEASMSRAEDLEFALRCVQKYPIGAVADPVVGIRKHESNISGDSYLMTCDKIGILQFALKHHSLSARNREVINEQIKLESVDAGFGAFMRGNFKDAVDWYSNVPSAKLDRKAKLKLMIASFPKPIASFLQRLALGLSAFLRYQRPKPAKEAGHHELRS